MQIVAGQAPPAVDRRALVAYVASNDDFDWMLDSAQARLLLTLGPEWFDGDRAIRAYYLAREYAFLGNETKSKAYADTARVLLQEQLRASPSLAHEHAALGLMLAFLGRKDEAIREGQRAVELLPVTKDAFFGPERKRQLAEIYAVVGEPERAVAEIREILQMPYFFNAEMFRVDPEFAPIRNDPGFRQLVGS
jgi:serine/threonine-protein kinase